MRTFSTIHPCLSVFLFLTIGSTVLYAQTASVTEGCPPLTVDFAPPPGQSSFYWEFQNGATSDLESPSTIYTQPGNYEVTFRESANGPVIGTVDIVVYPTPELSIEADPRNGCRPLLVAFTNSSEVDPGITVNGVSWTFGDGGSSSTALPSHLYSSIGTFTVSLALDAEQEGCSLTETFPDFVTVGGIEDLNFLTFPNPPVSCTPPLEVIFFNTTDTEGLNFSWDLGNGTTFEGLVPPTEIYDEPGTYPVVLTATDSLGCTAERTRNVRIEQPILNTNVPDTVCINDTLLYASWGIADSVLWQFPPGAQTGINNDEEQFVVFPVGGPQQVVFRAINYVPEECPLDTTFTIFVDEVFATPEADPSFTCENELVAEFTAISSTATEFQWLFFDGEVATGQTVEHTYTYVDTLEFSMNGLTPYGTFLIAINPSGCRDTLTRIDTIYAPNALFMTDVVDGCAPLTVAIADSSASFEPIVEWIFDYGDGTSATFTESFDHPHTYTEPGEYDNTLSILNEAGCRDTSYVRTIEVGDVLDYSFLISPDKICPGESINLEIIDPPEEVEWWQLTDPAFTLIAEYNGCYSEEFMEFPITVHGPGVEMAYELFCEDPRRVFFTSEVYDVTSIEWNFGDGNTSTELHPVHVYDEPGDYLVTITAFNDDNECPPTVDSRLVCIRNVQADFTIPENVCRSTSVLLNAEISIGVAEEFCAGGFTWYFENRRPIQTGDSIAATTFNVPGTETVRLVVKDVNGCRDTLEQQVTIYDIEADVAASDDFICLPAEVTFSDLSVADTALAAWQWTFTDGVFDNTPEQASYTYLEGGFQPGDTITVFLEVTDMLGCTATDSVSLQVYEPTTSILSLPSPANVCAGETIEFTATPFTDGGSFLNYSWDFGAEGVFDGQSISVTFDEAGFVPYQLTYTEEGSGCGDELLGQVNIQDYPTADFVSDADDEDILCYPRQISFTNQSSASGSLAYTWDFGNEQFSVDPNPVGVFEKGTYTVQLISRTSFGCSDTISRTYTLVGPEGDFTFGPPMICQNEDITFSLQDTADVAGFTWDFGDGTLVENVNPVTHTYSNVQQLGNRPVTLILQGLDEQCTFAVTDSIFIHEVEANFAVDLNGDTMVCAGTYQLINLSTGADTYEWSLPDSMGSDDFQPSVTVNPGDYVFSLIVSNEELGCVDTFSQLFQFVNIPNLDIIGDTALCPGDTVMLSVLAEDSTLTYQWSPVDVIVGSSTEREIVAVPDETTVFTVQLADDLGCTGEAGEAVVVLAPFPWIDVDSVRCPGDPLAVPLPEPGDLYVVEWSPAPPPDTIGDESLNLILTVTDILGCFSEEYAFMVASLTDELELPNIFSPNGDGVNDIFRVFSRIDFDRTDLIRIESFRVYNRWGQKVYDQAGPEARWDGTVDGVAAPADVYIYRILVDVPKTGGRFELTGEVSLVR